MPASRNNSLTDPLEDRCDPPFEKGEYERTLPVNDEMALRGALQEAHLPSLLAVYVHVTGDEAALETFGPAVRESLKSPFPKVPEPLAARLRELAYAALTARDAAMPATLSDTQVQHIMSAIASVPVSDEYVPLLREQAGLKPIETRAARSGVRANAEFRVMIIGAGVSGLAAAVKLQEAGYDFDIMEGTSGVGGTWRKNKYPGVGVDTPSHSYSYSFYQNREWSRHFPLGREMRSYLEKMAGHYDLYSRTRFNNRVISCIYDEKASMWDVTVETPEGCEQLRYNAIINSHGPLNRWEKPNIPGLDNFEGIVEHTADWNESLDYAGKRVAVIGTGSSGAQAVPAMAPDVEKLTVFMRSRHWVLFNPLSEQGIGEGARWAFRHIPFYAEWFRFTTWWSTGDNMYPNVVRDPDWDGNDLAVSQHNENIRQYCLNHLRTKLADRPDLIEKMTPEYPVFAKRIVLDAGFLDALRRDNVELETGHIAEVLPHAIRMQDGKEIPLDVIVLATGFNVSKMLGDLKVIGRNGRNLGEQWGEDDPRAYLGMMVPGFPNFFMTAGPNSASNHGAGHIFMTEAQVHYIVQALDMLQGDGASALEPTQESFDRWNAEVDEQMKQMIWTHEKAHSYYRNKAGRVFLACPFTALDYWQRLRKVDRGSVEVFTS